MDATSDESGETEEGEPDLLIIKEEGEADDQDSRSSHPARTVEGSRELTTQPAAATTEDPAFQPSGPKGNNNNIHTAMEVSGSDLIFLQSETGNVNQGPQQFTGFDPRAERQSLDTKCDVNGGLNLLRDSLNQVLREVVVTDDGASAAHTKVMDLGSGPVGSEMQTSSAIEMRSVGLMPVNLIPPSSFQAKSTMEGERDLQPWKKEEDLREMPGTDSGQRIPGPDSQTSPDTDQAELTEQLRTKHIIVNVNRSDTEPESLSQVLQLTGPGPVAKPARTTDLPVNSCKRRGSDTVTERPSCSSYAAETVSGSPSPLTKVNSIPPLPQMVRGEHENSHGGSEVKSEVIVIDPLPVDEGEGGDDTPSSWRQGDIMEPRHHQGGHSEADAMLLGGHSSNTYHHHPHPGVQAAARQNSPENLFYTIGMDGAFDNRLGTFQNPATTATAPFAEGTGELQYPSWVDFPGSAPDTHLGDMTGTHQDRGVGEEGARSYRCTFCGREYPHQCQLKMHQRVHTGEKPYECAQCGKQFSQLCGLKRHQRVHTGEKPFRCAQCGKQFSHSSNLKVHQSVHTGEKRFHCTQCGKNFSFLSNLIRHQAVHARKL
ncbi:unnamed protein product [Coregonus sp. 'balchen']|nr:unnamed protein product [Coregonus sp. 'balchen']